MRLVGSLHQAHPKPFFASVAGAILFAVGIDRPHGGDRARDRTRCWYPAFEGTGRRRRQGLARGALADAVSVDLRALGIRSAATSAGCGGRARDATIRAQVADRYRAARARSTTARRPTGELLAHMEADVKAAVDVFWPVPFATGVIFLVMFAMISLLRTDPYLARDRRCSLFPALDADEPAASPGGCRGRCGVRRSSIGEVSSRRARIDRRRARRQDARARGRRDRRSSPTRPTRSATSG